MDKELDLEEIVVGMYNNEIPITFFKFLSEPSVLGSFKMTAVRRMD